jgi:hypothetical protein
MKTINLRGITEKDSFSSLKIEYLIYTQLKSPKSICAENAFRFYF